MPNPHGRVTGAGGAVVVPSRRNETPASTETTAETTNTGWGPGAGATARELLKSPDGTPIFAQADPDWKKAGAARGLTGGHVAWSIANLDAALANGPAVIGVHYKPDSAPGHSDHYICVTMKDTDERGRACYRANDPGTGAMIRLYPDK